MAQRSNKQLISLIKRRHNIQNSYESERTLNVGNEARIANRQRGAESETTVQSCLAQLLLQIHF
jgi:hypothetical protein